jgi:hypothetical protein
MNRKRKKDNPLEYIIYITSITYDTGGYIN